MMLGSSIGAWIIDLMPLILIGGSLTIAISQVGRHRPRRD